MVNMICPKLCPLPYCVNVCPSGAINISEKENNIYIETDLCNRCGMCREACLHFSSDRNLELKRPWVPEDFVRTI